MLQKFIDYIKELNILSEDLDIDFSDLSFAYDYNEVQELFFDDTKNNYVFITGETGLRKKDMIARICQDLFLRGVEKQDILYLDYDLPILHGENILPLLHEFYSSRLTSESVYLIVNEIQEIGEWFPFIQKLKTEFPKIKLLCSSSTPPYIFETIYDAQADYCKIIVLSQKNASNIKYQTQSFGVYNEFKYNQKDGIIEIKGLTKEGKKMPHHSVPETINGLPVKIIASGAFHDRSELLSISLPDGIEMIGDYAFSKCNNLKEIRLPQALTHIGEHAFLGAKSLSIIIGGKNVVHIGNSAFYDTEWLKKQQAMAVIGKTLYEYLGNKAVVELTKEVETIASYAFADTRVERVIAKHDIIFGEGAFYNCKQLRHIDLNLQSIPPFAFYGCENLVIDSHVDTVGKFGLYGCSSIVSLDAQQLYECALSQCKSLKRLKGIKVILHGALWNCASLSSANLSNVKRIGTFGLANTALQELNYAGEYLGDFALFNAQYLSLAKLSPTTIIGRGVFYKCDKLKVMDISGGTKLTYFFAGEKSRVEELIVRDRIADDFNRNNPHLKTLSVIDVKSFGRWSFYTNSSLRSIEIINVKQIGDWAFAYCDGITQIDLPKETEYIGMNAFRYCHNLSEIKLLSNSVVMFGANAFYSTADNKKFMILEGLKDEYQNSPIWREYLSLIREKA